MSQPSLSEVARMLEGLPTPCAAGRARASCRCATAPGRRRRWPRRASSARLRERGHALEELREAAHSGRLAYGYMEELFPPRSETRPLPDAARETGLEEALIRRIWAAAGFSATSLEQGVSEDDVQLLRYMAAVLSAGFPLVAFLQLVRVYGQALAAIADAEVKLFHLFVHEPLIRDGVDGPRHRGGDGGLASRPAAARGADHGARPPALPAALHRAGRGRPPRARGRLRRRARPACGSRSPSPTSRATRG
jgi:adenylate cyclase